MSNEKPDKPQEHDLQVVVHYPAAAEPYHARVSPTETIGELKAGVLDKFGLKEGVQPDGSNASFTLYFGKTPLENLSETLGSLAGHSKELQFKLSQQITQGVA